MKIEHTTVKPYYNKKGELRAYSIYPDEGYRLHVKSLDEEVIDENTMEPTGEVIKGYRYHGEYTTVGYNYDFQKNPQELYTEVMQ